MLSVAPGKQAPRMTDIDLPRLAELDLDDILPDADFPTADFENFNPDVTAAGAPFIAAAVGGYVVEGEDALDRLERQVRARAEKAEDGRFNKTDALYQTVAPPPGVWDYRCRNCRFFQEGEGDDGGGHCEVVGHEEDPFGGRSISPEAWCLLWLPTDGTEWFDYIRRRAEGAGEG
jgi:hypothetical protein